MVKTSSPLVSIVMNCYNSSQYLREAIDSIYAQSYTNWEIIFWDNQSNDDSANIAHSYDEKIRYFCSDRYMKLGEGRNAALAQCRGDYIAYLDCDDQWLPDKLKLQIDGFKQFPQVGISFGNYFLLDESVPNQKLFIKKTTPVHPNMRYCITHYPVGILSVIHKRELLDEMDHWFDPSLNLAEDYDFFLRMISKTTTHYLQTPLALYRIHSQQLTMTEKREFPIEVIQVIKNLSAYPAFSKHTTLLNKQLDIYYMKMAFYFIYIDYNFKKGFKLIIKHSLYFLILKRIASSICHKIKQLIIQGFN